MHPFDLKAALLAKHAQHVVLIHFPIALFIAGVAFDFLAQRTKQRILAAAAYCNLLAAAVATVPVLITGILAWQWQLEGQRLKGILLMHLRRIPQRCKSLQLDRCGPIQRPFYQNRCSSCQCSKERPGDD